MSYILDALRKAERDRNLGRTPSFGDVTAVPARPPSRRPSPRTLALLGLVVGLLIATVLLWPRQPDAPEPPAASPPVVAAATPSHPTPAPPVPAPAPAPEVSVPDAGEQMLAPDVPAESIDDLLGEAPAPDEEVAAEPAIEEPPEPEPPPAAPDPESDAIESPPPPAIAPDSVPTVADEPTPPTEVASDVPLLRDMPSDYRGAFPSLRIDVHVYDADPARRWVMVNGRKAVEGTTLSEGPTVSRITPEGIVFDFRGSTSLFPLNR